MANQNPSSGTHTPTSTPSGFSVTLTAHRFLTTGNLCGCVPASNAKHIHATLEEFGELECILD